MSTRIDTGKLPAEKRYFAKFYKPNGNYIGTYDDISLSNFKKSINGGLGQLKLDLARPFDDFGEGNEIDFMNRVDIIIVDKDTGADGEVLYSGFIDTYEPFAGASGEGVVVLCLGYATRLNDVLYQDGTTVTMEHNTQDPSDMVRDIIDKYRASVFNPHINYTAASIQNTGTTGSYTFVLKNSFSSLEEARKKSPANWYWYVDKTNTLTFHPKPTVPTHTFTFRKDVINISVNKNIRDLKNQFVFWNGLQEDDEDYLCRSYNNQDSIDSYGLRMSRRTDSRLEVSSTMDTHGDAFIGEFKDPNIRVSLDLIDNNFNKFGYDLESITPGDTCQVLNLPSTSTTLGSNMLITDVMWTQDSAVLTLEDLRQKMSAKFSELVQNLTRLTYNDGPGSYTVT